MISTEQIRKVVEDFLSDNDVNKFALQFASLSHNIHKNGNSEAIELAHKIQSRVADVSAKLIGLAELKMALREYVMAPTLGLYARTARMYTSSCTASFAVSPISSWGVPIAASSAVCLVGMQPALEY